MGRKKTDEVDEFREFHAWLPKPYEELSADERDEYFREWAELRLRRRQSKLRAARREAYERDRERRERAHRLIVLGAEVEASGLADVLGHDPDAVFGAATIFTSATRKTPDLVERAAALGRDRDVPRSSPARTRKRGGKPSAERWRIAFPSAPPLVVREALRRAGFKWRLGLRAWAGDTLPDDLRAVVLSAGATISERPSPEA